MYFIAVMDFYSILSSDVLPDYGQVFPSLS